MNKNERIRIVTINPQKDGRIVLGTAVHLFSDCRTIKRRDTINIGDCPELVKRFPKCQWCYDRKAG